MSAREVECFGQDHRMSYKGFKRKSLQSVPTAAANKPISQENVRDERGSASFYFSPVPDRDSFHNVHLCEC